MAYNFVAAFTQYLSIDEAIVTAQPFTISHWFNLTNTSSGGEAHFCIQAGDVLESGFDCVRDGPDLYMLIRTSAIQFDVVYASISGLANTWVHCVCVCEVGNRRIYINNVAGTQNTGTRVPSGLNKTRIAAHFTNNSASAPLNGQIAELALYNSILNTDQINSLYKGITPAVIQPDNLVYYSPLIRDLNDVSGGRTITNVNSATVSTHPRIYRL